MSSALRSATRPIKAASVAFINRAPYQMLFGGNEKKSDESIVTWKARRD